MHPILKVEETFGVGQQCCVDQGHSHLAEPLGVCHLAFTQSYLHLSNSSFNDSFFRRSEKFGNTSDATDVDHSGTILGFRWIQSIHVAEPPGRLATRPNVVGQLNPSRRRYDNVMSNIRSFVALSFPYSGLSLPKVFDCLSLLSELPVTRHHKF